MSRKLFLAPLAIVGAAAVVPTTAFAQTFANGCESACSVMLPDGNGGFTANADSDCDGWLDATDNCDNTPNDQTDTDSDTIGNACEPDSDNDGVIDDNDNCDNDMNAGQENADSDALGDACDSCDFDALNDTDSDGYCADVDNCAFISNSGQENSDSDGLGDACDSDDDGDGVDDGSDACPTEQEDGFGAIDGCPETCANVSTDAENEISVHTDPAQSGDWIFGRDTAGDGSAFGAFAYGGQLYASGPTVGWRFGPSISSWPFAYHSSGVDVTVAKTRWTTTGVTLQPSNSDDAVARYTVPADGAYTFYFDWSAGLAQTAGVTVTADVAVRVNGVDVWNGAIDGKFGDVGASDSGSWTDTLVTGDVVDFAVDSRGATGASDRVVLEAFSDGTCDFGQAPN